MTVAELLERCSAQELTDWAAYENLDGPIGGIRGDIQAGVVASTIANMWRTKKGPAAKPKDFMIDWDRPRATTPHAMRDVLIGLTRQLGGTVIE